MQTRSSDRSQEKPPEQGRGIHWTREMRFYLSAFVLSQILYFGGSAGAIAWINWIRQCTATTIAQPPAPPPPTINHQQQHQVSSAQIAQHAKQSVIQALKIKSVQAKDKQAREEAALALKNMGAGN